MAAKNKKRKSKALSKKPSTPKEGPPKRSESPVSPISSERLVHRSPEEQLPELRIHDQPVLVPEIVASSVEEDLFVELELGKKVSPVDDVTMALSSETIHETPDETLKLEHVLEETIQVNKATPEISPKSFTTPNGHTPEERIIEQDTKETSQEQILEHQIQEKKIPEEKKPEELFHSVSPETPRDIAETTREDLGTSDPTVTASSAPQTPIGFDRLTEELNEDVFLEPVIPQRSIAREVEPDGAIMLEATRIVMAKPTVLDDVRSRSNSDLSDMYSSHLPQLHMHLNEEALLPGKEVEDDFDPDSYFSGSDDEIVDNVPQLNERQERFNFSSNDKHGLPSMSEEPVETQSRNSELPTLDEPLEQPEFHLPTQTEPGMIRIVNKPELGPEDEGLQSPVASPSSTRTLKRRSEVEVDGSEMPMHYAAFTGALDSRPIPPLSHTNSHTTEKNHPSELPLDKPTISRQNTNLIESPSSPWASPRPYKYTQSPFPKEERSEPPIFGVCVVGFHHQIGPEVEYWVGVEDTNSEIWPYLPFQSLPDGSHQFEENICYFTLLYDRNNSVSTSLTFLRDEDGHIQEGTSDFRNVTTLFAIACSRQVPLKELERVSNEEEYTRSVVQKSVVVIASKPIFGPIKEKLTVVTRSYFDQRNFNDRSIIDHFYENLVQMPLWINENDLQVGMNLQRSFHDFGAQMLVILKAMLLELKILFYASDTDVLGTTQFALISLVPNLLGHLEDSGSPLLSSYELQLCPPQPLKSHSRQAMLDYMGMPLQLFAGGGVFAPFVPLQQFEELKQPESRYGLVGTTNNLFLGPDIDFDMVVNIDTKTIQIRNSEASSLLKLSDADRSFVNNITTAVNRAWDTEETWQPEALGYTGGEDYIRHEFAEYLIALQASAKYVRQDPPVDPAQVREALSAWNRPWAERWMATTNNFRIFDQNTASDVYDVVPRAHPGIKLMKPSGFERFLGFFRPKHDQPEETTSNSTPIDTPAINTGEFEPQTPLEQIGSASPTPTPQSWFSRN